MLLWIPLVACGPQRRASDPDFHLLERTPSPDGERAIVIYNYDTGAVVPSASDGLNLAEYELPDGWRAIGWSPSGDLLVERWTPYYTPDGNHVLKTGDLFRGVSIRVVEPEEATAEATAPERVP
jgi:hypothetical protein